MNLRDISFAIFGVSAAHFGLLIASIFTSLTRTNLIVGFITFLILFIIYYSYNNKLQRKEK